MPEGAAPTDPKVYHGQESLVKIGDAFNPDTSTDLDTQIDNNSNTDFSGRITEITITDPEASLEVENTFGGQVLTESPADMVEVDFTMRFKDIEMFEQLHGTATSLTTGSDWTRINTSTTGDQDLATKTVGNKRQRAILFRLTKTVGGTTYTLHYLLNNAVFQQMGEVSLEADGTAELTGTAAGLVKDRYIEKNF